MSMWQCYTWKQILQVDMTSPVDAELGKIVVDKETARAQLVI